MDHQAQISTVVRGRLEIVFILLALQCGIGFLSAAGELLIAATTGLPVLLLWSLLLGFGVPAALAICAFKLQRGRRRAWQFVLLVEALLVLQVMARALFGVLPASALLALTSGAFLPLAVGTILLTPLVRAAFRKQRTVPAVPAATPLQPAA